MGKIELDWGNNILLEIVPLKIFGDFAGLGEIRINRTDTLNTSLVVVHAITKPTDVLRHDIAGGAFRQQAAACSIVSCSCMLFLVSYLNTRTTPRSY